MNRSCLLFTLIAPALACGGTTAGSDGGADATTDSLSVPDNIISTGCGMGMTMTFPVEAGTCEPQLATTTSCNGSICSWNGTAPSCDSDAGDAGDGGIDCMDVCNAIKPASVTNSGSDICNVYVTDAGTMVSCGGCGV